VPLGRQVRVGLVDPRAQLDLQDQQETEVGPGRLVPLDHLAIKDLEASQVHRVAKDSPDSQGLLAHRVSREKMASLDRAGSPVVLVPRGLRVPPDSLVQQD
jgi:hypothetical protein